MSPQISCANASRSLQASPARYAEYWSTLNRPLGHNSVDSGCVDVMLSSQTDRSKCHQKDSPASFHSTESVSSADHGVIMSKTYTSLLPSGVLLQPTQSEDDEDDLLSCELHYQADSLSDSLDESSRRSNDLAADLESHTTEMRLERDNEKMSRQYQRDNDDWWPQRGPMQLHAVAGPVGSLRPPRAGSESTPARCDCITTVKSSLKAAKRSSNIRAFKTSTSKTAKRTCGSPAIYKPTETEATRRRLKVSDEVRVSFNGPKPPVIIPTPTKTSALREALHTPVNCHRKGSALNFTCSHDTLLHQHHSQSHCRTMPAKRAVSCQLTVSDYRPEMEMGWRRTWSSPLTVYEYAHNGDLHSEMSDYEKNRYYHQTE